MFSSIIECPFENQIKYENLFKISIRMEFSELPTAHSNKPIVFNVYLFHRSKNNKNGSILRRCQQYFPKAGHLVLKTAKTGEWGCDLKFPYDFSFTV